MAAVELSSGLNPEGELGMHACLGRTARQWEHNASAQHVEFLSTCTHLAHMWQVENLLWQLLPGVCQASGHEDDMVTLRRASMSVTGIVSKILTMIGFNWSHWCMLHGYPASVCKLRLL